MADPTDSPTDDGPTDEAQHPAGAPRRWLTALLVSVIAVGLLAAGGGLAVALDRSAEADVRQLAFDISSTQTNQVGRMQGWLALWGLPLTSGQVMGWMGGEDMSGMDHGGTSHASGAADGAVMPGMATETELAELRTLSGTAFDVRFLQLMIRHHQGGLEMAQYGRQHAAEAAVQGLARSIAETQTAETTTMEQMLRARGGTPLPAP